MKRIALTGATGHISYSLLFRLPGLFESLFNEPIALHLLDLTGTERVMEGLVMELEDCAFPSLREIRIGTDPFKLFDGIDFALLVGAKPRGPGMERADLLLENGKIFVEQGKALNEVANRDVKVFVVGNPCNTNCLIAMHHAPNIPKKNFHAMMRLDHDRARSLLAKKAKVPVGEVKKMTIWGNHSATQLPDFTNADISGKRVTDVIEDRKWLQEEYLETIQKRGAAIIQARGKSSAASAANALLESIRDLYVPTPKGEWFTSGVCSDGNRYGIEEDLIFGFPCRSKGDGQYEIVENLEWDFFIKEKIIVTQKELLSERECVNEMLRS